MKRLCPSYKLVLHGFPLLVGQQRAVLQSDLFAQFLEARLHQVGGGLGIEVVDREFEEFSGEETTFDGPGLGFGKVAFFRLDPHDADCRLVAGQGNRDVQRVSRRPCDEFFRRITPAQSERRFEDALGEGVTCDQNEETGAECQSEKMPTHGGSLMSSRPVRKARSRKRGFVLLEAMMGLTMLTALGLILLKLSLNIIAPRQWTLQQSVTDAYMTYERAYAERIPFENLVANNSPWPASTSATVNKTTTTVEIGRLPARAPTFPNGVPIYGTVTRTRFADSGNYPIDGGTGTVATNPAAMKVWKVQSVLTYTVGTKTYAKSRTVLRSQ